MSNCKINKNSFPFADSYLTYKTALEQKNYFAIYFLLLLFYLFYDCKKLQIENAATPKMPGH